MKDITFDISIKLGEIDIELPKSKEKVLQECVHSLVFKEGSQSEKTEKKNTKRKRKKVSSSKRWSKREEELIKGHLHEIGSDEYIADFARRMAGMLPRRSFKATYARVRKLLDEAKIEARKQNMEVAELLTVTS